MVSSQINEGLEERIRFELAIEQEVQDLGDIELVRELALLVPPSRRVRDHLQISSIVEVLNFVLENGTHIAPASVDELTHHPETYYRRQSLVREFSGRLAVKTASTDEFIRPVRNTDGQ